MTLLSKIELENLVEATEQPCVSLYMPTHKAGPQVRQDPTRFKNLIRNAEEQLAEGGMQAGQMQRMMKPAHDLLDNERFWRFQNCGLAVFMAPGMFCYYRLPVEFEEFVVAGDRFHLKPLMPLLTGDGRFYILALSQNQIRLLQCTQHQVDEIDLDGLEDMPKSLEEALRYDDTENQTQFRSTHVGASAGAPGSDPGPIHGRGVDEDEENQILRFFSQVSQGLKELLRDQDVPMVLAGVEYLHPIYRQASSYSNLVEEGITGNPDEAKPEDLHRQAWEIVQPRFQRSQQEALDRYHELLGTGQATTNLQQIVPAAYDGQIETLFVAVGQQQWGRFDPDDRKLEMYDENQSDLQDHDLLDFAAVYTLLRNGTVYAVDSEQVPEQGVTAAIFRYPVYTQKSSASTARTE